MFLLYHYQHDPTLLENLWFSDESIFHLSCGVNQHNCRICGKTNPKAIGEHELNSPKLLVWCAVSSTGLIGPFFFGNEVGGITTVTGENYLQILQQCDVALLRTRNDSSNIFFNLIRPLSIFLDVS